MGKWKVIVPETTANLVENPSFEENVSDFWTFSQGGSGGTASQSSTRAWRGLYSALLTSSSSGSSILGSDNISLANGETITVTVQAWQEATGISRLIIYDNTNATTRATTDGSAADQWETLEATWTNNTGGNVDIKVRLLHRSAGAADDVYYDAVQAEKKSYATTYCDGDQGDCEWAGVAHNSTSERKHWSTGGRVRDLADDYSFSITQMLGVGLPPVESQYRQFGGRDGSVHRSFRGGARTIQLQGTLIGASLSDMHSKRQALIDVFSPRRPRAGYGPVARRLRYTGATETKEIDVVYDSGLELSGQNGFADDVVLRLIAPDPYWDGLYDEGGVSVDANDSLLARHILARVDGVWSNLGAPTSATNNDVEALARAADGTIYIGGDFTDWDGIANADYIVAYDPIADSYSALGTGMDGIVYALAVGADGTLYAGGAFTTAGGTTVRGVASWNGSSWSALGPPSSGGTVRAVLVGRDGTIYIGGDFTNWDGDGDADGVASWDGSSWSAMSTGLANIYAMVEADDGLIYATGNVGPTYIAKWNPDTSLWSDVGSGLNDMGRALAIDRGGTLYAAGDFTTADGSTANKVAKWNGTAWSNLGDGVSGADIYALAIDDEGILYAVGDFTTIIGIYAVDAVAVWDGSRWGFVDMGMPAGVDAHAVLPVGDDLYLGLAGTGTAKVAGQNTLSNSDNNSSSNLADAYPVFTIKREAGGTSAILRSLINETTGAELLFDYALLEGETLTIDLRPGRRRMVSSLFGERWKILPGVDTTAWALAPGDNQVMAYISEAGAVVYNVDVQWRPRYWSAD